MSKWQPIGTAPKDGTWFVGWLNGRDPHEAITVWCWHDDPMEPDANGWLSAGDIVILDEEPTHWMPLPEPPA